MNSEFRYKYIQYILFSFSFFLIGCQTRQDPSQVSDVIYTNGTIYTVNEAQPRAEVVASMNQSQSALVPSGPLGCSSDWVGPLFP